VAAWSLAPRGALVGLGALLLAAGACHSGGSASTPGAGGAGMAGAAGASGGGAGAGGGAGTSTGSGGSAGSTASGAGGASAGGGGASAAAGGGAGASGGAGSGGASGRGGASGAGGRGGTGGAPGGRGGASGAGGSATGSGGTGGARPTVTASPGTTLVKVNTAVHHQTFEGFGTSLCWWANHVGGWSATARNAVVDAVVDPTNGLGFNVFRYNIGGGENPSHDHMGQYHEMPGFEPSSGTWDWTADANQRAVLQRIVDTAPDAILEAFSNSPPYWMTKSGCASGNTDGSNNLKDDSTDAFADYLTEVVKHFHDSWGITFRTLEPLNEPNASWWPANGSPVGCHFSPSNQQTIIKAVGAKLTSKALTGTTVSASDENSIDDAYNNMRGFDATTLAAMSQMNTHTYGGSQRASLRTLATSKGKRLWQSESGPLNTTLADDTEAALFMAGRIITDLRDLQAEAWVDWQVGDPSHNWACFVLNDSRQTFTYLKRFYMEAAFARAIRPGATFVDVNNADMVAAVSADGHTLALVVRNGDTANSAGFTFDLTALPSVGASADAHRVSRTEDLVSLTALPISNWSFVATVTPGSITTFVVTMP
jgi:O-glycosyl hydrolase